MTESSLEDVLGRMMVPGAVLLTTGFKGGGKSHCAIAVGESLVKGKFPALGTFQVITNIIFLHRAENRTIEKCPKGFHHVTSMRELFPLVIELIEKYGHDVKILLILDEAQNFVAGENANSNSSLMFKQFLSIARKFRVITWMLTPSARSVGPYFRHMLNDRKYPGALTARWFKDLAQNKRYIASRGLSWDPRELMLVQNYDMDGPVFIRIRKTDYTGTKEELRDGGYCYDHEASATFTMGDLDWNQFNTILGGVSSIRAFQAVKDYFAPKPSDPVNDAPKATLTKELKIDLVVRAVEVCGLDIKTSALLTDTPYSTMRYWLKKEGIKLKKNSRNPAKTGGENFP